MEADDFHGHPIYRKTQRTFTMSDEAYEGLQILAQQYAPPMNNGKRTISHLLEAIGLLYLTVDTSGGRFNPISNITEEEYERSGYDDAMEQNPLNFELTFGEDKLFWPRMAYIRGYNMGKYILKCRKEDYYAR